VTTIFQSPASAPLSAVRDGANAPPARVAQVLFAVAFIVALGLELWTERGLPLWLDEAWTVGIAGPAPWIDFFHQVYWDVNAPLYYVVMYAWQGVFGQSDLAMRGPSMIFAVATPLLVAFSSVEGLNRTGRLGWASVMALWFPALSYAQEARCFAMLLFVSTLQTLAFIRLLQGPSTRRAAIWASFAALAILTHYDAIFLGAVQGLTYLAVHRLRAVRTWPAALAFIPAFGWLLYHLPRIVQFAQPGIAWYDVLDAHKLIDNLVYMMGRRQCWVLPAAGLFAIGLRLLPLTRTGGDSPIAPRAVVPLWFGSLASFFGAAVLLGVGFLRPNLIYILYRWPSWLVLAAGLLALGLWLVYDLRTARNGRDDTLAAAAPLWLASLASFLGATALIVAGFLRPSFAMRYLTPDGPGVLLGIVLVIAAIAGHRGSWALAMLVISLALAGICQITTGERMVPHQYNYEGASRLLEAHHPQRLVFLWDHPVDPIEHPEQLAAAGDAFFRRDGVKLAIDPVILKPGEDPNRRLLAGAAPPHSVILWVYDVQVHDSAALRFPPRITTLDPTWTCRNTGQARFGILACWRTGEAS
jgi:hypothetical protein